MADSDGANASKDEIPDKLYFKIGEVCRITGVKQHALRYWESEFSSIIRPHRASSKQRLYRRVDVENILKIKKLLREEGFSIAGAKKYLAREQQEENKRAVFNHCTIEELIGIIKAELIELKRLLDS